MDEIKQNQLAWSQLTQEHYQTDRTALLLAKLFCEL